MTSTNASSNPQAKLIQNKLIKTEIPELLAKLVLNNKQEESLDLLIAWGTHQKDNRTVWGEAKELLSKYQLS